MLQCMRLQSRRKQGMLRLAFEKVQQLCGAIYRVRIGNGAIERYSCTLKPGAKAVTDAIGDVLFCGEGRAEYGLVKGLGIR